MKRILVVDDEIDICLLLDRFLTKHGYDVTTAVDGKSGLSLLEQKGFDLVITDFRLPDTDGLCFLKKAKAIASDCKVIVITGYSDIRMAVEVIKYGAVDYITKPLYPEELLVLVKDTLAQPSPSTNHFQHRKQQGVQGHKPRSGEKDTDPGRSDTYLVGQSSISKKLHQSIALVAPTPMSVLITGETGTGKEFVAKRIHEMSNRAEGPFVAIDCGALPKEIAGSEFFGHEQGAFTGAIKATDGRFKLADGGTLFLDEIGNLSYDIQVKLLRVLQERKFTRVGGNKDIHTDVRIITATNENLKTAVSEGVFREDLYYRLNEFAIDIAPLRHRIDDMEVFAKRFVAQANILLDRHVEDISSEVWDKFKTYSWPGNIRQLKNVLKRCVLLTQGPTIEIDTLPQEIITEAPDSRSGSDHTFSLRDAAEEAERKKIVKVLEETGNNKTKAAKLLDIDRKTLYNKLKVYGI
jgi:two-component system response regulator HydG